METQVAVRRAPNAAAIPALLAALPAIRDRSIDAQRTFLTLLVVAHHAVLAYYPYAPRPAGSLSAEPMLWPAFPGVDPQRWPGIDLFVGFERVTVSGRSRP